MTNEISEAQSVGKRKIRFDRLVSLADKVDHDIHRGEEEPIMKDLVHMGISGIFSYVGRISYSFNLKEEDTWPHLELTCSVYNETPSSLVADPKIGIEIAREYGPKLDKEDIDFQDKDPDVELKKLYCALEGKYRAFFEECETEWIDDRDSEGQQIEQSRQDDLSKLIKLVNGRLGK